MPLTIRDDLLQEAGLSEAEARIESACRLFEAGKLNLWLGARWADLGRNEFESELLRRRIPIYRPDLADLAEDIATLDRLGT